MLYKMKAHPEDPYGLFRLDDYYENLLDTTPVNSPENSLIRQKYIARVSQ